MQAWERGNLFSGGKLTSGRAAFNFDGAIELWPFGAVGLLPVCPALLNRGTVGLLAAGPVLLGRGAESLLVVCPLLFGRGAVGLLDICPLLLGRGADDLLEAGPILLETATPLNFIRDCFALSWASFCSAEIGEAVVVC